MLVEVPSCLLLWLICLVVPNCIHAHPLRLSDAVVSKSESNNARDLESIFVPHDAPRDDPLSDPINYLIRFRFAVQLRDYGVDNLEQSRTNDTGEARFLAWEWKSEVFAQRERLHVCKHRESNFSSGRGTPILNSDAWLESYSRRNILGNHSFKQNCQIGSTLQFSNKLLCVGDLPADAHAFFNRLRVCGHRGSNSLHSRCRAGRLSNRGLNVSGLTTSDFVHFLYGFFEPASLQEKHNRLNATDNSDDESEPNHPPIGRRLIEVSCLIIGGFFLGLRGWENLDNNRRLIRAAFIGGWLILSICGWLLWFITFYRWTWSWWL